MPQRIVHIVYSLDIGGLERVLINCINGLPKHEHYVFVLTNASPRFSELLPNGVQLISFNKKGGHSWGIYKDIYNTLKNVKPTVVHTYNLATLEYQLCAFFAGTKTRIHAEHGRDIYDPEGKNKRYQWLRRLMSPFVQKFISVSDELHSWLQDTVRMPKRKTRLVYNGVNTDEYSPSAKSLLSDCHKDKFVFGCVGRLAAIKNQQMLIQAFTLACNKDEEFKQTCRLNIVGDGDLMDELKQAIDAHHMTEHIWLAGARLDMANVYRSFDCFVLSSLAEGIPMTVLEGMACGVPALATSVGGLPEIINHGKNGFLVEPDNAEAFARAMLYSYNKIKNNLDEYSKAARLTAERKFSETEMLKAYNEEYTRS